MFKLMAVFAYVGLGFLLLSLYRRERQKPAESAHDTMPADERRTEARWLTRRVSVMVADADSRKVLTRATIYDRSLNGMRLVAERNLDTGARLYISPASPAKGTESAKLEVRYCQRSDDGWLLGCKFVEPLTEEAAARFG